MFVVIHPFPFEAHRKIYFKITKKIDLGGAVYAAVTSRPLKVR